ncbi:tRNA glutamyl-Q synthetase [Vibrio sp. UCD-FRSSP16_10]|uniref:tRNA glutamyl-Q(34) synthetase GluQRS n=1 Tax=unclassified Vibrio TaxID=2614977 RepID=UPI0007FEF83B|nr:MULTISPECIES: tRNA glutamyl-Q(34) synthetase GluQRS [unclassified Vibrio]OBT17284.1 tRNA glutamyl-Q synthetase [Vibrio sp. UCD-FRSSP16_30]OBT23053.1 tRNA glutamyl-Q synthetase [Vibrio sp. UCD-FRSSP16_10]
MKYVGRFAPSPSGPLHFGSLVAALGSYFQAKSQQGTWLVRMEDLDPPREMPGAAKLILETLEAYHLYWDNNVVYQSQRHPLYQQQIDQWLLDKQAYYCQCTRKQIKAAGSYYLGHCREQDLDGQDCSIRIKIDAPVTEFIDLKQGAIAIPKQIAQEDFIIKRRDGLFAYNLAVVIDDIDQGITEVVRGADLIEPTGRQISLYQLLGAKPVSYLHLPLAVTANGAKLSKQNHAQGICLEKPIPTLIQAMHFLGFDLPEHINTANIDEIIAWGVKHWHLKQLPKETQVTTLFSNRIS